MLQYAWRDGREEIEKGKNLSLAEQFLHPSIPNLSEQCPCMYNSLSHEKVWEKEREI